MVVCILEGGGALVHSVAHYGHQLVRLVVQLRLQLSHVLIVVLLELFAESLNVIEMQVAQQRVEVHIKSVSFDHQLAVEQDPFVVSQNGSWQVRHQKTDHTPVLVHDDFLNGRVLGEVGVERQVQLRVGVVL